jgi:hypothetical protein
MIEGFEKTGSGAFMVNKIKSQTIKEKSAKINWKP